MTVRGLSLNLSVTCLLCAATLAYAAPGRAFDYDDLVKLIRQKNITGIEQLLPELPGEYLNNYTLIHRSRSLHGASPDFPRAILFGNSARLILSFNGSPYHSRYNDLEIMYFRDDAKAFELRSISFEQDVEFSEPNPQLCLGCHGISPGPIWGTYEYSDDNSVEHWPGVYGATHDAPPLGPDKGAAFARFRELAAAHPRYRHLRLEHRASSWFPYGTGPFKHRFRPNNRLGNLLARLNAKRLARHLFEGDFFSRYPHLSLQWLLRCPQAGDESFEAFVESRFRSVYPALAGSATGVEDGNKRMAFMFDRLLAGSDVPTWDMTLDPQPGGERFFTGIVRIDELVAAEVLHGLPGGHWLKSYYVPWSQQDLYDTFNPRYYKRNVAPGGVGRQYQALAPFYDRERARQACPELARHATFEIERSGV